MQCISAYCVINRIFHYVSLLIIFQLLEKHKYHMLDPYFEYASTVWNPELDDRTFK